MIFPVPQTHSLNGEAVQTDGIAFCVVGDDADFVRSFLLSHSLKADGNYVLQAEKKSSRETEYIDEANRLSDEKYRLDIDKNGIKITYSAKRGLFYALNTLVKLLDSGELRTGYIEDYPLFSRRGYIEGFYGKPWSFENRMDVLNLMAKHGMNTYFYAPKDDPYHRLKWREMYPDDALEPMKKLIDVAGKNEVDFYYCIAPGLDVRYSDSAEIDALAAKLTQLYEIGVSGFGLLLDDIPEKLQFDEDKRRFSCAVDAHIHLCNAVYNRLKSISNKIEFTVCPLQYHGQGNEYYISKFGRGLAPEINIFWTGRDICSQRLTVAEAYTFTDSTHHRPLYWDNYPVNDTEMLNEMHLGAIIGRDSELYRCSKGIISNTMEYAQCSKIPLLTVADYLWNPTAYDKEKSFDYALSTVLGDEAKRFELIAEHLQVSCLCRYASQNMDGVLSDIRFDIISGNIGLAVEKLQKYTDELTACVYMLGQDKPIYNELRQWSEKLECCTEILRSCVDYLKNPSEEKRTEISGSLKKYNRDATVLTGFCFTETVEFILKGSK